MTKLIGACAVVSATVLPLQASGQGILIEDTGPAVEAILQDRSGKAERIEPRVPIDLPPITHKRVVCSILAAAKYEVPANIVLAVAEKENGKPGQWVRNDNGTYDVGSLQFNTAYLEELARYGITPADVSAAGCYPYDLAAWRLRQHITKDQGDLWTRSANYHSRTRRFNEVYRVDLMKRAERWADWLVARYPTHEVSGAGMTPSRQAAAASGATGTVQSAAQQPGKASRWKSARYVPRKLLMDGPP